MCQKILSENNMQNFIAETDIDNIDLDLFSRENNDIILWVLQRQADIRMELIHFYKKDFMDAKEAFSAIEPDVAKQNQMMSEFVENYKLLLESAFNMVDVE